ncbi:hypothetical protein B0H12DRAFT_1240650 [Mycena haematopus]|nr:hypothetical protein B0H12DRAFT_1240650 [Mycena haematopus]
MKLMDIDSDTLGIPDTRIVWNFGTLGETVCIEVSKAGMRWYASSLRRKGASARHAKYTASAHRTDTGHMEHGEGARFVRKGESANGSILLKTENEIGCVMPTTE